MPQTIPPNLLDQYIGRYASPELAESDTLFRGGMAGLDAMRDSYQRFNGIGSDPFADASKARYAAIQEAATSGASVSAGGNMGPRMLSLPTMMQPQTPTGGQQQQPVQPVNSEGRPLTASAARPVGNSLITSMLQQQGNQYQLADKDLIIPTDPNTNNYLSVLEKRANLSGAGDLWREIYRSNPDVFKSGPSADPRFARIQGGGKNGKVEAADNIHPIAFDPHFMQELRQDPEKAKSLYSAVTNGRDYQTDVAAKSQLYSEQSDARKKLLEGIKGIKADPVTGALTKTVQIQNHFTGQLEQQDLPLTDMEQAAVHAEGGMQKIYGVDLPNKSGLSPLQGATQEENQAYRQRTQQILKQNPKLSVPEAAKIAHTQLYQEQNKSQTPAAATPSTDLLDTMMQYTPRDIVAPIANFGATVGNFALRNAGAGIAGGPRPQIPLMSAASSKDEILGRQSVADLLRQKLGLAASSISGNPIY